MFKHWKLISILTIVLLVAFFFYQKSTSIQSKSTDEKEITVVKKTLQKTISASGKIKAENEAVLKFQTSGLLSWVGVKEGDNVEKWQTIAFLDNRELKKTLEKSLRDYSKERWDFEEDKEVTYKDRVVTDTVKRILEKNQFDLEKSVLDVELDDIALRFATLATPISGIVTGIDSPIAGVNITPATASFTVSDPDSLIFSAEIDEADISHIKLKQKVLLTLDAYPEEEIKGAIYKIGFTAKTTSGGGNAFPVKIKLPPNKNLEFKIGMNGDANIIFQEKKGALVLPINVLSIENGKTYVEKLVNGNKVKTFVTTGLETDEETEIKKGLSVGDKVILKVK